MAEQKTLSERPEEIVLQPAEKEITDEMRQWGATMKEAVLQARAEADKYQNSAITELTAKFGKMAEEFKRMSRAARTVRDGLPTRQLDREDLDEILMRKPETQWERELHDLSDKVHWAHSIYAARQQVDPHFGYQGIHTLKVHGKLMRHVELAAGDWFASPSSDPAAGQAWVPHGFSVTMIDFYRLQTEVFGSLPVVIIPRGVGKYSVPVKSSPSSWRILNNTAGQYDPGPPQVNPTGDQHSYTGNFSTTNIELDPVRHQGATAFDANIEEDSIVPQFATHTQELVAGGAQVLDACVLNGQPVAGFDPTAFTQAYVDGYGTGFRHYCHVGDGGAAQGVTLDQSTLSTLEALEAGRKLLGKYGVRPGDLGYYLPPIPYLDLLTIGGSSTNYTGLTTIDKMGPNATLVTGQVANLYGSPVFVSEMHLENLEPTGEAGNPAVTAVLTSMEVVNRMRWRAGVKRRIQTEVHRQPGIDSWRVYATMRTHIGKALELDVSSPYNTYSANNHHTCTIYNVPQT